MVTRIPLVGGFQPMASRKPRDLPGNLECVERNKGCPFCLPLTCAGLTPP